ncbi:Protein fam72a [Linnemannia schmuckeri]|uniref:Protein fam72a n=1 Tax=Linnemannia schmuckeri TaxID=64567 RepID=A0A9P5RTU9_9FUNG|nr:Protein fam72a [Linnemannia schmuckeri]
MKAMLLADTSVELYSTDHPPGSVQLIDKDYTTSNCKCKIRDVACRVCGNVIGYHITQPCQQCLKAPNNGHFWMFHTEGVVGQERMNMDLGKLVQQLVRFPHSAAGGGSAGGTPGDAARRLAGFARREPVDPPGGVRGVQNAAGLPPLPRSIAPTTAAATVAIAADPRDNAATTRMTSISRLQRQQQRFAQTIYSPPSYPPPPLRVISSSPTPATPTPTTSTPTPRIQQPAATASAAANESTQSLSSTTPSSPDQHRAAPEPSMGPSATAALMNLTLSQFLQPMKWEQLPHPDLDIDLDPNTMGGEPLFAGDWMELVRRTAETAAANMSLALDQEEETEQYMARMMEEHRQRQLQQEMVERAELESVSGSSEGQGNEEEEEDVIELLPDHGEATNANDIEMDLEVGTVVGQSQQQLEDEERMDQLIHRVDDVVLVSPPSPSRTTLDERKDEDEDMDMNGEPTGRGRTLERRQHDSLPDANGVPAPEQQSLSSTTTAPTMESNRHRRGNSLGNPLSGIVTGAPPLHDDHRPTHRRRNSTHSSGSSSSNSDATSASSDRTAYYSPESCPAMVLTSAMIAKAAASAAAADAATAANNLLFGRRSRRDYDMMCR